MYSFALYFNISRPTIIKNIVTKMKLIYSNYVEAFIVNKMERSIKTTISAK